VYGERGIGKTSFCNVLLEGQRVMHHLCSREDSFVSIFRRLLSRLGEDLTTSEITDTKAGGVELAPGIGIKAKADRGRSTKRIPIAPEQLDLNALLDRLRDRQSAIDAFVLDEFENIDSPARMQLMEVVKGMADRGLIPALVLVGVAAGPEDLVDVDQLRPYVRRNIHIVHLPRLGNQDIRDLIAQRQPHGIRPADTTIVDDIVHVSCGYPFHAHYLAREACRAWLARWDESELLGTTGRSLRTRLGFRPREQRFVAEVEIVFSREDLRQALGSFLKQSSPTLVEAAFSSQVLNLIYGDTVMDPFAATQSTSVLSVGMAVGVLHESSSPEHLLRVYKYFAESVDPVFLTDAARTVGISAQKLQRDLKSPQALLRVKKDCLVPDASEPHLRSVLRAGAILGRKAVKRRP
jgi:AAA domain